ncbi:Far7p ASCRUDRAFT_6330 [Ascoidea rubescens DSM 1968]|uniref:Uncharacterized protein n=1 Tax=Ascoidea rubescens DSM 1968 TaxID=1344418 RepID=A0A1D2VSE6_9ASCO|nr:hypothetical protein ASCRUDRAFT_6330 [Ascoidea rubescens DSM 1968]ODV64533.1 hypothetical protein ASCRUDRAFT_6330 [Ascoidea rubescens DSM 1968]
MSAMQQPNLPQTENLTPLYDLISDFQQLLSQNKKIKDNITKTIDQLSIKLNTDDSIYQSYINSINNLQKSVSSTNSNKYKNLLIQNLFLNNLNKKKLLNNLINENLNLKKILIEKIYLNKLIINLINNYELSINSILFQIRNDVINYNLYLINLNKKNYNILNDLSIKEFDLYKKLSEKRLKLISILNILISFFDKVDQNLNSNYKLVYQNLNTKYFLNNVHPID